MTLKGVFFVEPHKAVTKSKKNTYQDPWTRKNELRLQNTPHVLLDNTTKGRS
jgi:hypothetical protein